MIKTFIPTDQNEKAELRAAAAALRDANRAQGEANKAIEAAKERLTKWLKEQRDCELATLPIGDIVHVEGIVIIEVGKMSKFDEKRFMLDKPLEHQAYKADMPVRRYKPLV